MGRLRRSRLVSRGSGLVTLLPAIADGLGSCYWDINSHRVHNARRDVRRATRTRARARDIDQIQYEDLRPENKGKLEVQELDEEKPGLGQHVSASFALEIRSFY